jgi:hypothetical protein
MWKRLPSEIQLQTLKEWDSSKVSFLRKESLYRWVEDYPHLSKAPLLKGLVDPKPGIRQTARFYLPKRGQDPYQSLKAMLEMNQDPQIWIAFADIAKPEDRPLFEKQLQSDHPKNRLAAFFYSLKQKDPDSRILDGLCNPFPFVAKHLQKACLASKRRLSPTALVERLRRDLPPSYKKPLLRILEQQSVLHHFSELLRLLGLATPSQEELLIFENKLQRLRTKFFLLPDKELLHEMEEYDSLLLGKQLPEKLTRELSDLLRFWKNAQMS